MIAFDEIRQLCHENLLLMCLMIYSMIMCSLVIAGFKLIEQTFLYNEDICNVMCRLN